ncbi:helix-turn-helix domain-containing protein [Roseateles terrae]|uniref:Transcriptional regulator with XRE-family HTH domain n=1 Tax=Roseateles terrae TaxID=431060 RepID=A0ABR6GTC2_9BURK|nr:helix-turn-helix domain-containing protein [Roseateles terrae]MBB3194967.1 transcriptional regulator with XRE-family HTH domain [Roseateles terrae]OWQ85789.1 hypothetical protein CDN98_13730 [Roseateles terrae]
MKTLQTAATPEHLLRQAEQLGSLLSRLRKARQVRQLDAATRAGVSRNTAYRIERGEPGIALGQILRYLDAIAPGATLTDLLTERDPSLTQWQARKEGQRVRGLTKSELEDLNF